MEGEDEESRDPRSFGSKVWRRVLIVIAGVVMNLALGFILLVIMLSLLMVPGKTER